MEKNYVQQGPRQQAIKSNCSKRFLYEVDLKKPDNCVEDLYGKFETDYSKKYKNFMNGCLAIQKISIQQKEMICLLYACFSARNEKNLYKNPKNLSIASQFTLGIKDKKVDQRTICNLVALANGGVIEKSSSVWGEELQSYKIQILRSDKPNIIFNDYITEQLNGNGEFFFPLCPTMVAFFTKSADTLDRGIRKITSEEYSRFIDLYVNDSNASRIFASNRTVLDEIVKDYLKN